MANNVLVAAQEKEEKCKAAFKEACLTYDAQKGQPGVTAAAVCELVGLAHGLSPNSKPKPNTVKKIVRDGRTGKSPMKKGPKPKWSPEVVQAAMWVCVHSGSKHPPSPCPPTAPPSPLKTGICKPHGTLLLSGPAGGCLVGVYLAFGALSSP